jgi:hypothetical protein
MGTPLYTLANMRGKWTMAKWAETLGIVLFVVGVLVWVGAKVHFLLYYDPGNIRGYVAQHWPFWAGMALVGGLMATIAGLGFLLGRSGRSRSN